MSDNRNSLRSEWIGLAAAIVIAVVIIVFADLVFARIAPPLVLREVDDAVAEYRHEDPTVLVLGPSHARTFTYFDREARRRTGGESRILAVPLEGGKYTGLEWVLEHRLRPLIEETRADGTLVRPSLRKMVVIGEWWDGMAPDEGRPAFNLPARAWTFRDFLADVAEHGFTELNRNYIHQRWLMTFRTSSLVQDHGYGRILEGLQELVRPVPESVKAMAAEHALEGWRHYIEAGITRIHDPEEWAAMRRVLEYGRDRGLDVTMLLYPRLPGSVTEVSRKGTLGVFSAGVDSLCQELGVKFVDWSVDSPLTDEYFYADLDHVTPAGNELLSTWGLDHDLHDLLESEVAP